MKPDRWLNKTLSGIFGNHGGLTHLDIQASVQRNKFSDYLPWVNYDPEIGAFLTLDNCHGYIWEIQPLAFCSLRDIKQIDTLLGIRYPKNTQLQVLLAPDHNLEHFLGAYKSNKTRKDPLAQKSVEEYAEFLKKGQKGFRATHGIPLRNFRAFVCVKTIEPLAPDLVSITAETLVGAHLSPRQWTPEDLVIWARALFNSPFTSPPSTVDTRIPLRKQIINAETVIDFTTSPFQIGSRFATVLTPKITPRSIDPIKLNKLLGGFMGPAEDNEQITTPFIWSVNVIFEDLKSTIHNKASATMVQKASGSFAKAIHRRLEELSWALDSLEQERFVTIIPSLVIFGETPEETIDGASRARRIWESLDFVMQEESIMAKAMFLTSLPFGLYDLDSNISSLDRHFYVSQSAAARLLPLQADFRGSSKPVLIYQGRKGQAIGVDVFDPRSNNHNFFVTAGSGSGKSVTLSHLCANYYAANARIRIVDIGGSYEKLAKSLNGRYLDFGKERICLNPFASQSKDDEDRKADQIVTSNILAEMAYSASKQPLHETEWTLIKDAVDWTIQQGRTENGVDAVEEYLKTYPKHAAEPPQFQQAIDRAREMGFNLRDFTTRGPFGRFFNGPSTFDIKNDDFVVLELERLVGQRELFSVVVMQVMNAVTQDLYLSDRADPRFILFEEAWQFVTDDQSNRLAQLIEEGYRRARKYHGAFGIVTQSPLDLRKFGPIGNVIKSNAAYKFFLESEDYRAAADAGILEYQGLALELLESVKNNKPKYSEIFLETPFGRGIGRLILDPWNYWVSTTDGKDVAAFNRLVGQGLSPMDALRQLSGVA